MTNISVKKQQDIIIRRGEQNQIDVYNLVHRLSTYKKRALQWTMVAIANNCIILLPAQTVYRTETFMLNATKTLLNLADSTKAVSEDTRRDDEIL